VTRDLRSTDEDVSTALHGLGLTLTRNGENRRELVEGFVPFKLRSSSLRLLVTGNSTSSSMVALQPATGSGSILVHVGDRNNFLQKPWHSPPGRNRNDVHERLDAKLFLGEP
jgi:hypothetical protein